jgi:probable rRNA maturation factor
MNYQAHLHCDVKDEKVFSDLTAIAVSVLDHEEVPPGELTIVLTDDHTIQELNRQYRGHDTVTDVLSFSDGSIDPDTERIYYGDVIIALPAAKGHAEAAGHPLETELALLTVHGVLHLLAYDHSTPKERDRMWAVQRTILANLGYQITLPEEMT